MVNLDSIGREEFARLFRDACQAAGISFPGGDWHDTSESVRVIHRAAADHLRASLKARLAEPAVEEPAASGYKAARGVLADLTARD